MNGVFGRYSTNTRHRVSAAWKFEHRAQIYVYDVHVLLVKYSLEPQMLNSIHKFHSRVIGTAGAVFSQAYS